MLNVMHVTPYLSRRGGGIPPVVWALANAQLNQGARVRIASVWDPDFEKDVPAGNQVEFFAGRPVGPGMFSYSPELRNHFRKQTDWADVVHVHGMWVYACIAGRKLAGAQGIPLIVAPHGMVEPWALARSRLKKAIAWQLFEKRNFSSVHCFHALCPPEAHHLRQMGMDQPIAVVPNGIDLKDLDDRPPAEAAGDRWPELAGKKLLVFIARVHPKKGLCHLVEAWGRLGRDAADWQLVIAGPDEVNHLAEVMSVVQTAGCDESVTYIGPVYGQAKRDLLASAQAFVLPSFSEGFSMAVLEAMACSLPVLITPQCNFPQAIEAGAGIMMNPDVADTEQALRELVGISDSRRHAMGQAGRELVQREYTWSNAASKLLSVYQWARSQAPKPDHVRLARSAQTGETP